MQDRGGLLFIGSVISTILLRRSKMFHRSVRRSRAWSTTLAQRGNASKADKDYNSAILELFRGRLSPSERGQKHKVRGSADLFAARKQYFQDVWNDAGMDGAKVIHIAGTKGKGSVVEYISACLRNTKDTRVGVFTSPHLHTARERIKVGSKLIGKADMTRLGRLSLANLDNHHWSVFFDHLLESAIRFFGENKANYVVLETGIGGRFDSTNFVDTPSVGVITSISYDHMNVLGDKLEQIAWQKAGIIKAGMDVFTPNTQDQVVLDVIAKQCVESGATLHVVPIDLATVSDVLRAPSEYSPCFNVQVQNACLAKRVVEHLNIDPWHMQTAFWPCRMEGFRVRRPALPGMNLEPGAATVVLDGAHNGDSVDLFLSGLRTAYPDSHIRVLFGASLEKCLSDMLKALEKHSDSVVFVQSRHFKSASEVELQDAALNGGYVLPAPQFHIPCDRVDDGTVARRLKDAIVNGGSNAAPLSKTNPESGPGPIIAICGSLFAAAEAREALFALEPELFAREDWVRSMDCL